MLTTQAREIVRCVWFGGCRGTDRLIFFYLCLVGSRLGDMGRSCPLHGNVHAIYGMSWLVIIGRTDSSLPHAMTSPSS